MDYRSRTCYRCSAASLLVLLAMLASCGPLYAGIDDFDVSDSRVSVNKFLDGGPGKDGIPALLRPKFIPAYTARFLTDTDEVIGVTFGKEVKAYPVRILNWHEIVLDDIGGVPIAVTWCPLTRSAFVYRREVDGEKLSFGVSGLLYNSNLVMYDARTSSLWPQLSSGALTGKFAGKSLTAVASRVVPWQTWKAEYTSTEVLSDKTGYFRDYAVDPYERYHKSPTILFPVEHIDRRLPLKVMVIGIVRGAIAKAYPIKVIRMMPRPVEDTIGGKLIKIYADSDTSAYITDTEGHVLPAASMYWFAWSAFHNRTRLFGEEEKALK